MLNSTVKSRIMLLQADTRRRGSRTYETLQPCDRICHMRFQHNLEPSSPERPPDPIDLGGPPNTLELASAMVEPSDAHIVVALG